jgi:hypothetical protein
MPADRCYLVCAAKIVEAGNDRVGNAFG